MLSNILTTMLHYFYNFEAFQDKKMDQYTCTFSKNKFKLKVMEKEGTKGH